MKERELDRDRIEQLIEAVERATMELDSLRRTFWPGAHGLVVQLYARPVGRHLVEEGASGLESCELWLERKPNDAREPRWGQYLVFQQPERDKNLMDSFDSIQLFDDEREWFKVLRTRLRQFLNREATWPEPDWSP